MGRVLKSILASFVRRGSLRITTAEGTTFALGDGTGNPVAMRFMTRSAQLGVLIDPELKVGEAYMDGTLVIEEGTIADLLAVVFSQDYSRGSLPGWARPAWLVRYLWRRLQQFNPPRRARRNVAHHYDLDGRLYSLFLDADRQYSCAYFEAPDVSLDDAQLAKKRHLAAKLLDGAGIGFSTSARAGAASASTSRRCAARASPASRCRRNSITHGPSAAPPKRGSPRDVEFRLEDYRDIAERFDRIVSVGMFEHVGVGFYDAYFRKCRDLIEDDGVIVLHSIGRSEGPNVTNPFIAKYIFPGWLYPGPVGSAARGRARRPLVTDIEILRLHYAETLKAWRERFLAHRDDARSASTTRASCACGNSISRPPRWRSGCPP